MRHPILLGLAVAIGICGPARAEVPRVAAEIAPIHSLVAQVMGDVGTPDLILPPGASPHGYAMRPSEARALSKSDILFRIGDDLTPWMSGAIDALAPQTRVVNLLDLPGTQVLEFRDTAIFGAADEAGGHEGHDHAENATHDSDAHAGSDDHAQQGHDPHAWLSPQNAMIWISEISRALAEQDPENAETYASNAAAAISALETLTEETSARLKPLAGLRYVVFHDAYQYFETAFDLPAQGALSLGNAADPGAARVAEIRALVREHEIACVAAEPQFNASLVQTVAGGDGIRTTVLDPLGAGLDPGPDFYAELIGAMTGALLDCL